MHAVRQSCRPKHQVLILKCYPRFQKSVAEVKPNPSELSYLLYYASTRRSKLQKVGSFLEKKTANDVTKSRVGNVQVTLQILKALIEKLPRDLPLYAHYVLGILSHVLKSKDLTIIEDSIPTFDAFCQHHDVATLAADQEHIENYENVVRIYSGFAEQQASPHLKSGMSAPTAIRWKTAGLSAVKSITASDAVGADGGRQMRIIMPAILQNLRPDDPAHLLVLQQRIQATEIMDKELALKRRISNATVKTVEAESEPSSAALSGSTDDVDRLAEEEVGLLALKSLKQIFIGTNRAQVRIGTAELLRFFCGKVPQHPGPTKRNSRSGNDGDWTTAVMEMVTKWTPVSDRFIILVTIMETLVRSPIAEENLDQQLILVTLVGWLLKSTINMIGLSVMDVLLGLIQHILLLLQLGGKGSNLLPHHQQTDAIDLFQDTKDLMSSPLSTGRGERPGTIIEVSAPSTSRQELLARLQKCIADLATHVYYSDQVSDIITAILLRLKPSPTSDISTTATAIENPKAAAQAISDSVSLKENPETDEFFSFGTARVTALKAIKDVLTVANMKSPITGGAAVGRNRVGVQVWEGTQWLLRDEDRRVRRAYVDALLAWLRLEMSKNDLRIMEDKRQLYKSSSKVGDSTEWGHLTRRAVSNASHRGRTSKPVRSTFLQLLHLAVYDNAVESPESEADLLLIHLLLVNLIEKLGVNAVHTGLPMIIRLQEDINQDDTFRTPTAKLNIGSVVHGYFWALSEKFDFESSRVGYEIHSEISRRQRHSLWLKGIRLPPIPLEHIISSTSKPLSEKLPLPVLQQESLHPFDSREVMVDQIAIAYSVSIASPPASPPSSPSRLYSIPMLPAPSTSPPENDLPQKIKNAMLSKWSKEICIASVEQDTTRAASLNGSRNGTNLSTRHKILGLGGDSPRNGSPTAGQSPTRMSPNDPNQSSLQHQGPSLAFHHASSPDDGSPTPVSSSDQNSTLRVDDLKRVLANGGYSMRTASPLRSSSIARRSPVFRMNDNHPSISTGSESAVSAEGFESASEGDTSRPLPPPAPNPLLSHETAPPKTPSQPHSTSSRTHSFRRDSTDVGNKPSSRHSTARPSTSSTATSEDPTANAMALRGDIVPSTMVGDGLDEDVPPVPPLPPAVAMQKHLPIQPSLVKNNNLEPSPDPKASWADDTKQGLSDGKAIIQGGGAEKSSLRQKKKRGVDVEKLLGSIDAVAGGDGAGKKGGSGKPPY
ncbi:MAG: hypothetical protein LQ342_006988 [Letrouitia transgressa]|nr:MAG: hypothetical protein LQ342_006988 [Letrouitia transgressa]